MNDQQLQYTVLRQVLSTCARNGQKLVPVNSSNRHVHLCQKDVDALFGQGYQLTKMRDLAQPGQYAANERVTIETEKGKLTLRVVAPVRKETQVELSITDAVKLGIQPMIRMSGDIAGTPGATLANGDRRVKLERGVIVAARHLHMAAEELEAYGLQDGDVIALEADGVRKTLLQNVAVRTGPGHIMEAHIDKDEANACFLSDGQLCRVVVPGRESAPAAKPAPKPEVVTKILDLTDKRRALIGEADVLDAHRQGYRAIRYAADAALTPLAVDAARDKAVELYRQALS